MTTCIYGSDIYKEGAFICVNGRGLRCVSGEWQETGQPCGDGDATEAMVPLEQRGQPVPDVVDPPSTKARR